MLLWQDVRRDVKRGLFDLIVHVGIKSQNFFSRTSV